MVDPRFYSADLLQGGLELPCKLMLIVLKILEYNKIEKLVQSSLELGHLEPVQGESTSNVDIG